ncbi:hypothetical protein MMC13_003668 [Lambiella insularis]|nr:hypothetical protein [Lambiella insularis]
MRQPRILISGAGVAGPVLAYWLDRAGASVTLVERDSSLRSTGQAVDIRDAAVDIIRKMGIEDDIRAQTTHEDGISWVDTYGRVWATLMTSGSTQAQSITSEFEILRGDLAIILYNITKDRVKYIFGETVKAVREIGDAVEVDFAGENPTTSFDAVVAADGQRSNLRSMVFDTAPEDCLRSLGLYVGYFTLAEDLLKGDKVAKIYNAPGGKQIFLRPNPRGQLQAYAGICTTSSDAENASSGRVMAQKDYLRKTFDGAGWVSKTVIKAMENADDFYFQSVVQVKMKNLSRGRVALVGDAGYCPSPISGMGTSLAVVGAYVLAGEIMKHPNDLPTAFQNYKELLTPFIVQCQKLPPGAPGIVNPQTQFGITVLHSVLWFVTFFRLDRLISRIASIPAFSSKQSFVAPKYEW